MNASDPLPLRRRRRRQVIAVTVVVVLLLGSVALKLTLMQVTQLTGARAWSSGDPVAAEHRFALNHRVNLVQRWVAPYNSGVAAHGQRAWQSAADWFEVAAGIAPESHRCRVVLNWAWSLEAAGDELAEQGDQGSATLRWNEASAVLDRAVGCDDSSAGPGDESDTDESEEPEDSEPEASEQDQVDATAERLETKSGRPGPDPEQPPSTADQADRLDERNREAARERQQADDGRESEERPDAPDRTW